MDLRNPTYEEGVLSTEEGGVLQATNLRVQAEKITYIRQPDHDPPICSVSCSGNLLVDYGPWVLIGESFFFDFITERGYLTCGKTASPPWYMGGKEILLLEGGTVVLKGAYITTSEGEQKDLLLEAEQITLNPDRLLCARNIRLRVNQVPLMKLPKIELDLNSIGRSPFALRFGWGGFLGSHLSLLYQFLAWRDLTATARIDGFFGKGVGGGIETAYDPKFRPTQFYTRNYYAYDIPLDTPQRKNRYRFQGTYYDKFYGMTVDGMYDVVSDALMAADYQTRDFELLTAGRTQIEFRKQECGWIANLFTRLRVNDFQSVNQELPSLQLHLHPFEIPHTGIIAENHFQAGYLDYVFSDDVVNGNDFSSFRVAAHPFFYRPYLFGPVNVTPEAGFIGVGYTSTPDEGGPAGLALGEFGLEINTAFSKCTPYWKHVLEPYAHYQFLTLPTVGVGQHYIFTIRDGLSRFNVVRMGVRSSFFTKIGGCIQRPIWMDLWTNAFIDTPTLPTFPKGYLKLEWDPFSRMHFVLWGGWNFEENLLDFYNTRVEWTLGEWTALSLEYRHRSAFDWRKADFYNFMLESVRTQRELLLSPLSDRRDTLLIGVFVRVTPDLSFKLDLRHGWNRIGQPPYTEYQIEMGTVLFEHWKVRAIYEKRESDNRYSISMQLNPGPPSYKKACRY